MAVNIVNRIFPPNAFDQTSVGQIGGVGDALTSTRLRQSSPDMPLRYYAATAYANQARTGSKTGTLPYMREHHAYTVAVKPMSMGTQFQNVRQPISQTDMAGRSIQAKVLGENFIPSGLTVQKRLAVTELPLVAGFNTGLPSVLFGRSGDPKRQSWNKKMKK